MRQVGARFENELALSDDDDADDADDTVRRRRRRCRRCDEENAPRMTTVIPVRMGR